MKSYRWLAAFLLCGAVQTGQAESPNASNLAEAFGARPFVESASLSPDGKHLVFVTPGKGPMNVAMVQDVASGDSKPVTFADGKPLRIRQCGWSANDRLVCRLYGVSMVKYQRIGWSRIVALDTDGSKTLDLGRLDKNFWYIKATDGGIIDWLGGDDGKIVMARLADGPFVVEKVDTRTGKGEPVKPSAEASLYIADGAGAIRIVGSGIVAGHGYTGSDTYQYRLANDSKWLPFSKTGPHDGLRPIAVDGTTNLAWCLQELNGHDALYTVALDGTLKTTLIFADPNVDVNGVEQIGRNHRVIGYRYVTDRLQVVYTDPVYKSLAASLRKALPHLPIIDIRSTSADEKKVLLFAASDVDPGHYFLLDRSSGRMTELLRERPQLDHQALAEERSVTYPAADGTPILAYLLLPPGGSQKRLPAIVMPHGGPAERDVWGFDWLAQYFAARGYAVLQPEYRGSYGFGTKFLGGSGFKSWHTAISDVNDAGHWLVSQGIADPAKLGIFGWSYGGYAALQSNYLDPNLFKAAVAVAPLTDLAGVWDTVSSRSTMAYRESYIGTRTDAVEGSPLHHADSFKAPVLMFHGDMDVTVDVDQAKHMDTALKKAGKQTRLVVYPGLDHQLDDADTRTDMLTQSDAFFRKAFGIDRSDRDDDPHASHSGLASGR